MRKIFKNFDKSILHFGIFAFLLGFIALLFSDPNKNIEQPLFDILIHFPPIFTLGLTLIFASIFEELAFRGWIIKNKAGKIISYIGIILYVYFIFKSILIISIVIPIIFVIFFILKNGKWKLILSVFATSLLFGIVHFENFTDSYTRIFAITQLIGLSFIISYVGLKFGFWYCILVHFINNLIGMFILFVFLNTDYSGKFENTSYKAELSKIQLTDLTFGSTSIKGYDTSSANLHITEIARFLAKDEKEIIFKNQITNLIKYKFTAIAKDSSINHDQLFEDFIKYAKLDLDTSYEQAYTITVSDTVKLKNIKPSENTYQTDIQNISYSIRSIYNIPLILSNEGKYPDFYFELKLLRIKDKDEFIKRISDEYGILIQKDNQKKATIITIKEKS